jgi:MFS family permease
VTDLKTRSDSPGRLEAPTRAHWWILVVIAGAQLMVVLDTTIMIIALPSAQHSLGFSNADRQWVVTAYTLGFGGLLLLGGRISDMVGPKRTLMVGVVGFAVASALGGASQTTGMLIGARALQGSFGALLAPSVLSLLTANRLPGSSASSAVSSGSIGYQHPRLGGVIDRVRSSAVPPLQRHSVATHSRRSGCSAAAK